ncbi:unnamed protein product [Clavelina lepadiformis]|uniref:Uncharacterized protein n=1 Tax=Clavelina lepadiformis TaxID=159417 RepID=A0ABP0GLU8_CLALP
MDSRSPQRVKIYEKKQQVRYFHRVQTYRKSRSARTTKREKKTRIKVDVSLPVEPYEEPVCYVKLAIYHQVAAFYTGNVLRCDTTIFCNELCDYVCGGINNGTVQKKFNSRNVFPDEDSFQSRTKANSYDSGFFDDDYEQPDTFAFENAFVNIDIKHNSVWFSRVTPESQRFVFSTLYPQTESATETEFTGPTDDICFRWHKDLEESAASLKRKRRTNVYSTLLKKKSTADALCLPNVSYAAKSHLILFGDKLNRTEIQLKVRPYSPLKKKSKRGRTASSRLNSSLTPSSGGRRSVCKDSTDCTSELDPNVPYNSSETIPTSLIKPRAPSFRIDL